MTGTVTGNGKLKRAGEIRWIFLAAAAVFWHVRGFMQGMETIGGERAETSCRHGSTLP